MRVPGRRRLIGRPLEGDRVAALDNATYGWVTPVLAYALSFLGSLLGLAATARARSERRPGRRARWLVLAAWAIGGTGIWVMHFMAMIGFSVEDSSVRFDLPITIASWLTAVVVVGIGLFAVGYGRPSLPKVLFGGVFTGLGVAGMHYTGMRAMHVSGDISYDRTPVYLSIAVAVVAATAALWFTVIVRSPGWIVVAAGIMGVAVTGMHYTGMAAVRVHLDPVPGPVTGIDALSLLIPILVFVLLVVGALAYAVLATPSDQDLAAQTRFSERMLAVPQPREPQAPPTSAFVPRARR
jgi:NO-binding membrane sensor protein with MHYT domain